MPAPEKPDPALLDPAFLGRAIRARVRAVLKAHDPHNPALDQRWTDTTRLDDRDDGDGALGLQSVALMDAATAVATQWRIDAAGLDDLLLARRRFDQWAAIAARAQAALHKQGGACVTVETSGTTGPAKAVTHPTRRLLDETAFWAAHFQSRRRIVAAVPAHHIYGLLFTVFLPQALHVPVLEADHQMPGTLIRALAPGDLVIGHPDFWRRMARALADGAIALPRNGHQGAAGNVAGVTSTAPFDDALTAPLQAAGLALTDIVGASETGGLGWRPAGAADYTLLPNWQRHGDTHLKDRQGHMTEIPDHLDWTGPRRFRVAGRRDGMVQVAGHNVCPDHVRAEICAVTGVAAARVTLEDGPYGARLHARVTAATDPATAPETPDTLLAAVRDHLATHLPAAAQPRLSLEPAESLESGETLEPHPAPPEKDTHTP
ncbi:AMP-binding protein [Yunchengibacter salinarum]|uniref:AMP-binding protein n=1 Tax=Yunchengibacter salinarum TaxID=3133399 RepID=UPI0035B64EC1